MAACGVHHGLLAEGVSSRFYYLDNQARDCLDPSYTPLAQLLTSQAQPSPLWFIPWLARSRQRRLNRRIRKVGENFVTHLQDNDRQTEVFSQPELVAETRVIPERFPHHILHLHWTAFAFDWPSFFASLPRALPIIWTLHDQNPYTGGCHFVTGCERFKTGCGSCPQLRASHPNDLSQRAFRVKQAALAGRKLHVVAPSRWMLDQAQQSPIFRNAKSFTHIPYGMDMRPLDAEHPGEQNLGQRLLPTVLFGAEDLENQRKGIRYAIQAINELAYLLKQGSEAQNGVARSSTPNTTEPKRLRLWTFGKKLSDDTLSLIDRDIVVKQWGFLTDRRLQGQLYRAADVFWLPSLEDNQPQTALEAMACGTPVIGFNVGGVPEIVRHQQTGLIVPVGDAKAIAQATWDLLKDRRRLKRLSVAGRQMVRQEFSPVRQATAYIELYQQVLEHGRSKRFLSNPAPHFAPLPGFSDGPPINSTVSN